MLASGVAPGIVLPANQALKAQVSPARILNPTLLSDWGMARMMIELIPEVNRAFSAGGFLFHQSWGAAPGFGELRLWR